MARSTRVFQLYRAADGWRWKVVARNGRNLGNGSQGYERRGNAVKGFLSICCDESLRQQAEAIKRSITKRVTL